MIAFSGETWGISISEISWQTWGICYNNDIMMKPSKSIILSVFLTFGVVMTSCIEVNGSGYNSLTEQEKLHVKSCKMAIENIRSDGNLYKIRIEQIRHFINKRQNVLVYEYLPFCSGESGRSPEEVQQICKKLHWECIVISSVYDGIFPLKKYNFPIFVIDNEPFHTNNYQVYSNEFYRTLTKSNDKSRRLGVFHYFRNGQYIRSYTSIFDIKWHIEQNALRHHNYQTQMMESWLKGIIVTIRSLNPSLFESIDSR